MLILDLSYCFRMLMCKSEMLNYRYIFVRFFACPKKEPKKRHFFKGVADTGGQHHNMKPKIAPGFRNFFRFQVITLLKKKSCYQLFCV